MGITKKIYACGYWGATLTIVLLIVTSILMRELRKEGVVSEVVVTKTKETLWFALVLCGLVMWAFAIQRLVFVWRWSSVNKKISGLLFVMLFPAICGYYLYYMDKQEAEQEARKSARQAANEPF